jgi:hypothetical protein
VFLTAEKSRNVVNWLTVSSMNAKDVPLKHPLSMLVISLKARDNSEK